MNYIDQLSKLDNKINYTNQEIGLEKDNNRKKRLYNDLEILKLRKEMLIIRNRIIGLEMK